MIDSVARAIRYSPNNVGYQIPIFICLIDGILWIFLRWKSYKRMAYSDKKQCELKNGSWL